MKLNTNRKDDMKTEEKRNGGALPSLATPICSALTVDDCKTIAAARCLDIFNDFEEIEIENKNEAIKAAWRAGRDLHDAWNREKNVNSGASGGSTD